MKAAATLKVAGPPVAVVLIGLLVWELGVRAASVPAYQLPPPSAVARAFWEERAVLVAATGRTALATLAGFGLASLAGIAIGSVLTLARWIERGVYPLTLLFQMVPLVAIAPLLVIWLGNGIQAVVASSAIVAVFPVIASTVGGLRSVDPQLEELFRLYGAGRWQRWVKLGVPSAIPSVLTGLRVAAGLATIGAVVGEFVAGFGGDSAPLGMVILTSLRGFQTDLVFAAVALAALVGFVLFGVVSLLSMLGRRRYGEA